MAHKIKFKGKIYYIHQKGSFYYLSKNKSGALDKMPEGYSVEKNKKGTLVYLKKN